MILMLFWSFLVNFGFHPPHTKAISPTIVLSHWHPQQRTHTDKSVTSLAVCPKHTDLEDFQRVTLLNHTL